MKNEMAQNQAYLKQCEHGLNQARESGDPRALSLALADYAYALSINKRRDEAMDYFYEAEVIAGQDVDDINVLAHGLGLRSLVYQEGKRLPDAYQMANKMLRIAVAENDPQIECDAIANQAQILLDSGKLEGAFRRFQEAENLAKVIGDDQRLMRIKGALANLSLSIPSLDEAEKYYRQTISLAENVGEEEALIGYTGNLGSVLQWKGKHEEAIEVFQDILPYHEKIQGKDKLLEVLKKLVKSYADLQDNEHIYEYGFRGLGLIDEQEDEVVFDFLEPVIMAYYREGKMQKAHNMISEAITIARSMGDQEREVEFLMNLGESFVASEMLDRAQEIYEDALEGALDLEKATYEAYLKGRLGYVAAELGNLEAAVKHHREAIEMAQEQHLAKLEAEQRSMLAMAFQERGEMDMAREQAQNAVELFERLELEDSAQHARRLLKGLLVVQRK